MNRNEIEEWAKDIRTERVTVSRCIASGPCYIHYLALSSNSSGAATATIYNGISAKGDLKVDMTCIDDYFDHQDFWPPMYFDRGIFVDVGSNVSSVMVRYCGHSE